MGQQPRDRDARADTGHRARRRRRRADRLADCGALHAQTAFRRENCTEFDALSAPKRGEWWSDGEEVPGAGVGGRVAELAHRAGLDLTDPLPGEVEVLPHLFERPRLAAVQTEAQCEDLT